MQQQKISIIIIPYDQMILLQYHNLTIITSSNFVNVKLIIQYSRDSWSIFVLVYLGYTLNFFTNRIKNFQVKDFITLGVK